MELKSEISSYDPLLMRMRKDMTTSEKDLEKSELDDLTASVGGTPGGAALVLPYLEVQPDE